MKVLETVLYTEDLESARGFYVGVLGLEEISFDASRDLFMKCAGSVLIIFKASRTIVPDSGVPPHGATGCGHLAFSATQDELVNWKTRLENAKIEITREVTWKNGARSIYFCDPAGNVLEFATPDLWGL